VTDIEYTEINVEPLPNKNGLIGFVNVVVNNSFKFENIAIHTCPSNPTGIRLVFPTKESSGVTMRTFFPINRATYESIAVAVSNAYLELMEKLR